MKITVGGGRYNGSEEFWPAIEQAVCALAGHDAGRLTRIARQDGGVDYRSSGVYELTLVPDSGDAVEVTLTLLR